MKRTLRWEIAVLAVCAGLASQSVVGQQTPPTENKGVTIKPIGTLDLGPELDGMSGRQLRLRMITLEPGGVFAVHDHKDRPAVEQIFKGSATEFRGSANKEIREGEAVSSDRETTHWWRNDGSVPAIFIVADVFHPKP